jgi:hypothetical protein
MSISNSNDSQSSADLDLQRRIALALLNLRVPRFGFLHFQAHNGAVTRLAFAGVRFVQVEARAGRVTLSGSVQSEREKRILGEFTPRVPGVLEVVDQIRVVTERQHQLAPCA